MKQLTNNIKYKKIVGGCNISFENININLSDEDIYYLLIKLKRNPDWNKRMERIINSDLKTNVGNGSCPFPFDCSNWFECEDKRCNADALSNGYAYRMS